MLVLCIEINRLLLDLHFVWCWVPTETMLERLLLDVLLTMDVGHPILVVHHLVFSWLKIFFTSIGALLLVLSEKNRATNDLVLLFLFDRVSGVAEIFACT